MVRHNSVYAGRGRVCGGVENYFETCWWYISHFANGFFCKSHDRVRFLTFSSIKQNYNSLHNKFDNTHAHNHTHKNDEQHNNNYNNNYQSNHHIPTSHPNHD